MLCFALRINIKLVYSGPENPAVRSPIYAGVASMSRSRFLRSPATLRDTDVPWRTCEDALPGSPSPRCCLSWAVFGGAPGALTGWRNTCLLGTWRESPGDVSGMKAGPRESWAPSLCQQCSRRFRRRASPGRRDHLHQQAQHPGARCRRCELGPAPRTAARGNFRNLDPEQQAAASLQAFDEARSPREAVCTNTLSSPSLMFNTQLRLHALHSLDWLVVRGGEGVVEVPSADPEFIPLITLLPFSRSRIS